jgi:DNA-binding MarR family transcriptional regulator
LGQPATDYSRDVGFLLSQLGYRSAALLAEQLLIMELTPAHAGIMRAIAAQPGQCQRALSAHLGVTASRIVAYVDDLEKRGYVERHRHQTDRRSHALHSPARENSFLPRLPRYSASESIG